MLIFVLLSKKITFVEQRVLWSAFKKDSCATFITVKYACFDKARTLLQFKHFSAKKKVLVNATPPRRFSTLLCWQSLRGVNPEASTSCWPAAMIVDSVSLPSGGRR